jgi:alpha-amylase
MIERWIEALHQLDFSAEEMADATWLALLRYRCSGDQSLLTPPDAAGPHPDGADETPPAEAPRPRSQPRRLGLPLTAMPLIWQLLQHDHWLAAIEWLRSLRPLPKPPPSPAPRPAPLFTKPQASPSPESTAPMPAGTAVKIQSALALRDPLTFVRALRPLIRQIPTGRDAGLDEAATAQKIADERVWLPVMRPQVEPWLDLALVVDESPSMVIWRRTVWELVRLCKHYGAFRDVRVWGLISGEQLARAARATDPLAGQRSASIPQQMFIRPEFSSAVAQKSLRRPEMLIDPNQRQLVLVLSDCVSSFWREGTIFPALKIWASAGPLALVQMLPDWMWSRTVLNYAQAVGLYGLEPAIANQQLVVVRDAFSQVPEPALRRSEIRVPVLTLEPERAATWSQMVGGKGSTQAQGLIFNPVVQGLLLEMEQQRQFKPAADLSPADRVQRFKAASTLIARRLAGLLAAAPVITLPIVRLIQQTLVPESRQVHVAEVLLGGLMAPTTPLAPDVNPEAVEYQFKDPEIRTLLLKGAPLDDTATILLTVSNYVIKNLQKNTLDEFVAYLQERWAQAGTPEHDDAKPFAIVAAEVLKRRGLRYADFVEAVDARYPTPTTRTTTGMASAYQSFADLQQHERAGEDYRIRWVDRSSSAAMTPLTMSERQALRRALVSAFPSFADWHRLIFRELDLDLQTIVNPDRGLAFAVTEVIQDLEARGQIYTLIDAASRLSPNNPALQEFITTWQAKRAQSSTSAQLAVLAIHGGRIEPGTTEVAEALAGEQYSFYTFEGLKPNHNEVLRLPSHRFDEPRALALLDTTDVVVAIDGCEGEGALIQLGGLADTLQTHLRESLLAAGFQVAETRPTEATGLDPAQEICNRGQSGAGVQVSLSRGLRDRLLLNPDGTLNLERFLHFIEALKQGIEASDRRSDGSADEFPELQVLDFETEQLGEPAIESDATRFPPLQTETVDVVTIEYEPEVSVSAPSQTPTEYNGTLMQWFHWYLPADGSHWRRLQSEAPALAAAGVTALWLPPAYKGMAGAHDVGYGVYDLFDLGEFDQKGSVRTKYGTKDEYVEAVRTCRQYGVQIYADVVFNHKMAADYEEEFDAIPYDDRDRPIGDPQRIKSWTGFSFPGRGNQYSTMKWHWYHFDAVDYNSYNPGLQAVWKIADKHFEGEVVLERGTHDFLMGADLDMNHPEVRGELKYWGEWMLDTIGVDGFRLDAIKHINGDFFNDWLDHLEAYAGRDLFCVGEYWSYDLSTLSWYIGNTGGRLHLFDAPLHYNFHRAGKAGGQYDMRQIFDGTLMKDLPQLAVTLVENHDTQPLQALESQVESWFKPLAYAMILLREQGYPCIFYADYYGAHYRDRGLDGNEHDIWMESHRWILDRLLFARQNFAYGPQYDYIDHFDTIGWTRLGTEQHPYAMAVILSDGPAGRKWMEVGKPNQVFEDITETIKEPIQTNEHGWAEFRCNGGSVSVWVERNPLVQTLQDNS